MTSYQVFYIPLEFAEKTPILEQVTLSENQKNIWLLELSTVAATKHELNLGLSFACLEICVIPTLKVLTMPI